MNIVKLVHNYKVLFFFQFFNSPVTLKNIKKIWPPKKVEMTPLYRDHRITLFARHIAYYP